MFIEFGMGAGSIPEEVSFEGEEEHPLSDRLLRYEYCERTKKIPSSRSNGAFVLLCEPELILPRQATDKHTYGKSPEFGLSASAMIMMDGR